MRYAIYFTPPAHDPLLRLAAQWLGRDAFKTNDHQQVAGAAIAATDSAQPAFDRQKSDWIKAPQRYGFHATLKAPFRLAPQYRQEHLPVALQEFTAQMQPVELPRLKLALIGRFFALVPEADCSALQQLANDIAVGFDRFRAPLNTQEIEKRRPERLSPSQRRNLEQWGYPYLFEDFRFHMSLTGPVNEADQQDVGNMLSELFTPVLQQPVTIAGLALFIEPEPDAPFMVHSLYPLRR